MCPLVCDINSSWQVHAVFEMLTNGQVLILMVALRSIGLICVRVSQNTLVVKIKGRSCDNENFTFQKLASTGVHTYRHHYALFYCHDWQKAFVFISCRVYLTENVQ